VPGSFQAGDMGGAGLWYLLTTGSTGHCTDGYVTSQDLLSTSTILWWMSCSEASDSQ
jgi:hypothetical protein